MAIYDLSFKDVSNPGIFNIILDGGGDLDILIEGNTVIQALIVTVLDPLNSTCDITVNSPAVVGIDAKDCTIIGP